jgi:hypothetical protein
MRAARKCGDWEIAHSVFPDEAYRIRCPHCGDTLYLYEETAQFFLERESGRCSVMRDAADALKRGEPLVLDARKAVQS